MKFSLCLALLVAGSALAQQPIPPAAAPPADVPAETVVATVNGKKITAGDIAKIIAGLPPQLQQNFDRDKREFIRQYALLTELAAMAEREKLAETSPHKERLEYVRMQVLVQAMVDDKSNKMVVTNEEQQKAYEAGKDKYTQAKVRVIYIPFSSTPATAAPAQGKSMTEAEAKAKADSLVKQARAGANFVKLVKEHSQDPTSVEKDGAFGVVSKGDSLPEPVKTAIFALAANAISDPVRQPNGFYIFRADEIGVRPYEEVKDDIYRELKEQKFNAWFLETRQNLKVTFDNEAYFGPLAGAPAHGAPAQQPK
jgi:peptidyl-prolyl cis-trans isomerase C